MPEEQATLVCIDAGPAHGRRRCIAQALQHQATVRADRVVNALVEPLANGTSIQTVDIRGEVREHHALADQFFQRQ